VLFATGQSTSLVAGEERTHRLLLDGCVVLPLSATIHFLDIMERFLSEAGDVTYVALPWAFLVG
jgi:hypothetical protein